MFGYLLVKKEKYENLDSENSNFRKEIINLQKQLDDEKKDHEVTKSTVRKLSEEISGKTSECNVGPWCQDCQHRKFAQIGEGRKNYWDITLYSDGVYYCGKHTHDLCPEWEAYPKNIK